MNTTVKSGMSGLGAIAIITSLVLSGFMLSPSSASAFWWPWWNNAHAQEGNDDDTYTVTIQKYVDGELATDESADNNAFPMMASWDDSEEGEGSGSYTLSSDNNYEAETDELNEGSDYSTHEVLDGDVVAASCDSDTPYKLVGYTTGTSSEAAASADPSSSAPSFTNLQDNQYVIVWNETCEDDDGGNGTSTGTSTGSITGEVTGGSTGEDGELAVTSIEAVDTTATANGEFEDGWKYVFHITVPENETGLAMKFADWVHSNGNDEIPVANNMRISSEQADATSTILLTAENTYSSPDLNMVEDLDAEEEGLQVEVLVEVAIPENTVNGTYSTDYGIRSQ